MTLYISNIDKNDKVAISIEVPLAQPNLNNIFLQV